MARKQIRSRDVVLLEGHIVGDKEMSYKSLSYLETSILITLVSLLILHDDQGEARDNNNDGLVSIVEQAPSK